MHKIIPSNTGYLHRKSTLISAVFDSEELGHSVALEGRVHGVAVDELMQIRRALRALYSSLLIRVAACSPLG